MAKKTGAYEAPTPASDKKKALDTAIAQIGTVSAGAGSAGSVVMMSVPIIIFIVNQAKIVETMGSSGMKD